uniref:Uncharacterized protein n=1 Tax=Arundo donax TaxID=35708 RepID=A0A0A9E5Q6_ARUDO
MRGRQRPAPDVLTNRFAPPPPRAPIPTWLLLLSGWLL